MEKTISIVVPCYNEQEALPIFYNEVIKYLKMLPLNYELIFVDDGSKDRTAITIKGLAKKDENVKYVIFSRNFGKEAAMYAGLEASTGDYVAIMDADLQDPPVLLESMYKGIEIEGYDCVGTRRVNRIGEPKIKSWFARMFYKIINKNIRFEIVDGARDYRLMTRKMVDAILELKEYNRFSKGLFGWVGFKTKWLEYENVNRCAGVSKWNFAKLFAYALEGFVSFSLEPLYLIMKFGFALMLVDVLTVLIMLLCGFAYVSETIIIGSMVFLTGGLCVVLGIVAIYQAKMYNEIKHRPIYIAKEDNLSKNK